MKPVDQGKRLVDSGPTVHPPVTPARRDPPYDGSAPCPFCPAEVRNLFAVAHNLVIGSLT